MEPVNRLTEYKRCTDLVALIAADTRQQPRRSGKWMTFSCPFPGHKHEDRNRSLCVVNPNASRPGYWKCYGCLRSGSAVDWLIEFRSMSIKDVLRHITDAAPLPAAPVIERSAPEPAQSNPVWENRGFEFMQACAAYLWGNAGQPARDYLMNDRRLTEAMLRTWDIGFNPVARFENYSDWGLAAPEDGQRHAIYLGRGVVIPCFEGGELFYLKIRPLPAEQKPDEPKYKKVTGSRPGLFGIGTTHAAKVIFAVEGEFNAMVLWSAINRRDDWQRYAVISTGSASDIEVIRQNASHFLSAERIIAVYDQDAAGLRAIEKYKLFTDKISHACLPGGYKDLNEYHQAGGNLVEWTDYQMEMLCA